MVISKRKICVVTGTRAEYGLLKPLMKKIQTDNALILQLIATGMHLSPEFGLTYEAIEQDGFAIDAKIEMLLSSDTAVGITKSMGVATISFADVLDRLRPDIMVVLGDRYEILAAAQAAMVARIPIAHIHGGEATEGLIDEAIRHSVTKMSHIHFVATDTYRQRVIQLGENPDRVFNVGALALDTISQMNFLTRDQLENELNFQFGHVNFLVTYHPVTLSHEGASAATLALLEALDAFPNSKIIFTKPNADTGGRIIAKLIDEYAAKQPKRVSVFTSLGQLRYFSIVRQVNVVIGNSSSGIIEVPAFRKPTVNIGDRQRGRIRAATVIDCTETALDIAAAIKKALSAEFLKFADTMENPYGKGNAAESIYAELKNTNLSGILQKRFYDLRKP